MKKDWLYQFLSSCVRAFRDEESEARVENFRLDHPDWPLEELIRRWIEFRLRQTGVVYGTPLASEETIAHHTSKGYAQRRAVFLAILGAEAELAMEVGCAVSHCTVGNIRVCELLVCFALLCREFRLADTFPGVRGMLAGLARAGAQYILGHQKMFTQSFRLAVAMTYLAEFLNAQWHKSRILPVLRDADRLCG